MHAVSLLESREYRYINIKVMNNSNTPWDHTRQWSCTSRALISISQVSSASMQPVLCALSHLLGMKLYCESRRLLLIPLTVLSIISLFKLVYSSKKQGHKSVRDRTVFSKLVLGAIFPPAEDWVMSLQILVPEVNPEPISWPDPDPNLSSVLKTFLFCQMGPS